jgi:tripeptidyl-peptidase-1
MGRYINNMASALFTGIALMTLGTHGKVLQNLRPVHSGWSNLGQDIVPSQPIHLSIALRQPRAAEVEQLLISSEKSPNLSGKDIESFRAPDEEDKAGVLRWLADNGVTEIAPNGAWIDFISTVGGIESMLQTKLTKYAFEGKNGQVLRASQYSIPDSLSTAIEFIHPISNFMPPQDKIVSGKRGDTAEKRSDDPEVPCADNVNPACMREAFKINYHPPTDGPSPVRFGVAGFLGQNANFADSQQFLQEYAPAIAKTGYNFTIELLPNATNSQDLPQSGDEASLDLEYAMALGYPANVVYYQGPDDNEPYPFLNMFNYLLDLPDDKLPHIFSISYAANEPYVPIDYAMRTCSAAAMLSARGTTILSASGDGGAAGIGGPIPCQTADGKHNVTMAVFPASCPYITAVGATGNGQWTGWGGTNSGGGFSVIFPQPPWQAGIIEPYIEQLDGHLAEYYNGSNRALPDITTFGELFQVITRGFESVVGGTSASTPTIGALLALINDKRLRQGKPSLGFINKALYSKKVMAVMTDILNGTSNSCTFGTETPGGWPAATGWDAISGVGRPDDFGKFMEVMLEC